MQGFTFTKEMFMHGWPILSVLLACSVLSLGVMLERWIRFRGAHMDSEAFLRYLSSLDGPKAQAYCERFRKPLARIGRAILEERGDRQDKEDAMVRGIAREAHELESYLAFLGTVASVAPYVGLLGTVIGIIKAFHAISASGAGGPAVVAVGIAEALVGTAGGLLVAIPALVAYNYFSNKISRMERDWEIAGNEIVAWSSKR